jgi:hypothetical protein
MKVVALATLVLACAPFGLAQRAIPDDNLTYPVRLT